MSAPDPGREAVDALRRVVAGIEHAEERPGQDEMAHEVSRAIASSRPIIVQAGTGTGKSLGYLVPAVLSGKKTVVATATKTLQDQLGRNDLPLLAAALDVPFTWAVLKGRSNYVCAQRLRELSGKAGQMEIEETVSSVRREIDSIVKWASTTRTGDLEDLPRTPPNVRAPRCRSAPTSARAGRSARRARSASPSAPVTLLPRPTWWS